MELQTISTIKALQHLVDMPMSQDLEDYLWSEWKMVDMGNPYGFNGRNQTVSFSNQTVSLSNLSSNQRDILVEKIASAIRHSSRVAKRERIKANRFQAVDQFMVSLRRELLAGSYGIPSKELVGLLCNKAIWHDIGVLTPSTAWPYGTNVTRSELEPFVQRAQVPSHTVGAQCDEILGDIESLQGDVNGLQLHVQSAERIAEQGEEVISKLAEVFS